ncbi:hypothetical protein BH20ACT2_BH20ACT2_21860 [soil metagenome]
MGSAPAVRTSTTWPGWDIARAIALHPGGGGHVLDGWGGVHPFGGAPRLAMSTSWPGWEIARGLVISADGLGGYVLDGWGGVHPVGSAPAVRTSTSWPGWDIARAIALHPGGGGYVLDGWGGLHPFGGAPRLATSTYWPGWDIARGLVISDEGLGGYVLDGWGGVHPVGDAPAVTASVSWPGWDIARGIASAAGSGSGGRGRSRPPVDRTYTFEVRTRGGVRSDVGEFARLAMETFNDDRGWRRARVGFELVASGGDFTLWLAAPASMRSFSTVCSAFYSCRVGRNVIINDDRWATGSPFWPGSVSDYRDLVLNHELGHWLGLGHRGCGGPGQVAPVMMQQSKGLDGCRPNPWPLADELQRITR